MEPAAVANINALIESRPDVVVLSVNSNRASLSAAQAFAEQYHPNFPLLLDQTGSITQLYQPFRTPFWFFINPEGVIVAVRVGEHSNNNLLYRVNEYLPLPKVVAERIAVR